jgi:hypothetical protein
VPWKDCNQMDERLKFIARLLDGEKMAVLCRELAFEITADPNDVGTCIAKLTPIR